MNCRKAETWLSRAMDGELSGRRATLLEAHLAGCPSCRKTREAWQTSAGLFRSAPIPDVPAEAVWMDVRRGLRQAAPESGREVSVFGWRVAWATASLAIVLAVGGTLLYVRAPLSAPATATRVEWVETGLPNASPMIYEDAESGMVVIWVSMAREGRNDAADS